MIVVYGTVTDYKREGYMGEYECPNCSHKAAHNLCKQTSKFTIYYIPIFWKTGKRGIMCESCGHVEPLSKSEYNAKKESA